MGGGETIRGRDRGRRKRKVCECGREQGRGKLAGDRD